MFTRLLLLAATLGLALGASWNEYWPFLVPFLYLGFAAVLGFFTWIWHYDLCEARAVRLPRLRHPLRTVGMLSLLAVTIAIATTHVRYVRTREYLTEYVGRRGFARSDFRVRMPLLPTPFSLWVSPEGCGASAALDDPYTFVGSWHVSAGSEEWTWSRS